MPRRRKPSWVFLEWIEIVLDKGALLTPEERRNRWEDLYKRAFVDGKWLVNPYDAGLVASWGIHDAVERGDHSACERLANEFLTHPDIALPRDESSVQLAWAAGGVAKLLQGDVQEAADRLRAPLLDRRFRHIFYQHQLLAFLDAALRHEPDKVSPLDAVANLVADAIASKPGNKRLSARARLSQTPDELLGCIESFFSKRSG